MSLLPFHTAITCSSDWSNNVFLHGSLPGMCCCPVCVCVCVYEGPADSNTAGIGTSRPLPMSISLSVVCSAQKKAFVASALPVLYLHTEGAREREGEEIGGEPWLLCAWGAQHRDQPRCSHNAPAVTFGCMHPFKGDPFFSFLCICFILIAFCWELILFSFSLEIWWNFIQDSSPVMHRQC